MLFFEMRNVQDNLILAGKSKIEYRFDRDEESINSIVSDCQHLSGLNAKKKKKEMKKKERKKKRKEKKRHVIPLLCFMDHTAYLFSTLKQRMTYISVSDELKHQTNV